jgi:predicted RNA-binding Zn-ribbon protein involved in translation (DUF1610 family)
MPDICHNCGKSVNETAFVCPSCGALFTETDDATSNQNQPARYFCIGMGIGCLLLVALISGSIGTCLTIVFITALPAAGQLKSFSGYANILMIAIPALGMAGLCIIGIRNLIQSAKNPKD